jgi:hypothetical protein
MAERRERLGRAGEAMLPTGSGPPCVDPTVPGPCKGGQVEGVIFADVDVGTVRPRRPVARRKRGRTPFSVSRPIAASKTEQRNVALAARGKRVWAVWEQGGRLRMVRSRDGGRRWSKPWSPARQPGRQWWPDLDVGADGRVWLVWQQDDRVVHASSRDGRRFGAPRPLDASGEAPQWRPSIAALEGGWRLRGLGRRARPRGRRA